MFVDIKLHYKMQTKASELCIEFEFDCDLCKLTLV